MLIEVSLASFSGLAVGLITASLGAWKDTLFEPFDIFKFFRSPLVCLVWSFVLAACFPDLPLIATALCSSTCERLSVEGYKALIRQPPGKFRSPVKDRGWLIKRMRGENQGKVQPPA